MLAREPNIDTASLLTLMRDWQAVSLQTLADGSHMLCLQRNGANVAIYSGPFVAVLVSRAVAGEAPDGGR